jgi:hypothetical protein
MKIRKGPRSIRPAATLFLLTTVFYGTVGLLQGADPQQFQQQLFDRYAGRDLVCNVNGVVLGLDISNRLQPNFAVEYAHFHESLGMPERYRPQDHLDDRTFGDSDARAVAFDVLARGERLHVLEFYTYRDSIVFYLVSPSITRFQRSARTGGKKFFGVKFTFLFPLDVIKEADYDAVVAEIDKYFLPVAEFNAATQALGEPQTQAVKRIEIEPGLSEEELTKILGPPERAVVFGRKTILSYSDITIELEENSVIDVKAR